MLRFKEGRIGNLLVGHWLGGHPPEPGGSQAKPQWGEGCCSELLSDIGSPFPVRLCPGFYGERIYPYTEQSVEAAILFLKLA